jgi:large subunit ribosomal protein L23
MEAHFVIRRPTVTEKGTYAMNEQGRYTFEVDPRASKTDIKAAVEALYKVKVEKVNTLNRRGQYKRMKFGMTQESCTKTAIVRLKKGNAIELF